MDRGATLKITCFIDNLSAGGAQRQMVMLAILLQEAGHRVTLLTYYPHDFFLDNIVRSKVEYVCINEPRLIHRVYKVRKALLLLEQDIVIAFLKTPVLLAELSLPFSRKWKLIVSERNANPYNDKKLLYRRFFHIFSDYVVVNSYTNQDLIRKNAPWIKNIRTIYNCVDSDYFFPKPHKNEEKFDSKLRIIAVGKYSDQKNILGLIKALHNIKKKHDMNIQIDWFGDKVLESNIYKDAKKEIKKFNLSQFFYLHGPSKTILDMYQKSSVMILPSFYEGVPNVVCEAMSCGLPVLASDINDNRKFITNGENGYLFNPYDNQDISNAIIKFYKLEKYDRELMGLNSRKKAKNMFSKKVFLSEYLEVIHEL
jgi:glycosyltransferase involved in cell wall biosynthesis